MVSDADGSEYPTQAVYDEVRPPELLVVDRDALGHAGRTEFVALGPDRTEVRIHQTYVPEAFLAPRGPGRVPDLARPLRRVSRRAGPVAARRAPNPDRRTAMTDDTALTRNELAAAVADEYVALADLLEAAGAGGVGRAVAVRGLAHP